MGNPNVGRNNSLVDDEESPEKPSGLRLHSDPLSLSLSSPHPRLGSLPEFWFPWGLVPMGPGCEPSGHRPGPPTWSHLNSRYLTVSYPRSSTPQVRPCLGRHVRPGSDRGSRRVYECLGAPVVPSHNFRSDLLTFVDGVGTFDTLTTNGTFSSESRIRPEDDPPSWVVNSSMVGGWRVKDSDRQSWYTGHDRGV